jgi:hypothetical protein
MVVPSREGWVLSRLIIVDQSLKRLGGHHFDYVLQISQAAARRGAEVVVVAHQQFTNHASLQHYARILPHFRQTTYSRYSLLAGLRAMHRRQPLVDDPPTMLRKWVPNEIERHDTPMPSDRPVETANLKKSSVLSKLWPSFLARGNRAWRSLQRLSNRIQDSSGRTHGIQTFSSDCARLFPTLSLMATDHVFFTTINDLELAGLLVYWMGAPESYLPHWHLQFHFDAFQGRVPEYRKQYRALDPLRCLFEDIDNAVPTHQLHYYATTAAIADQYQRLASHPIAELVYPISEAFRLQPSVKYQVVSELTEVNSVDMRRVSDASSKLVGRLTTHPVTPAGTIVTSLTQLTAAGSSQNFPATPLWSPSAIGVPIVIAGGIRSEKGQKGLQEIWPELQQQVLGPGLGFLVCQRKEEPKWYQQRFTVQAGRKLDENDPQVQYVPHPLSTPQYQELIRNAGIGLLTYDPGSYANRRAGIFGEYLASGVPTLVPAGTWMADQLAKFQSNYHQQVLREQNSVACWSHSDFDWTPWNVPTASGGITFDGSDVPAYGWSPELPFSAEAESAERLLSLRFHWIWPKESGTYCRVEILFYDQQRQVVGSDTSTVGQPYPNTAQSALFRIPAHASHFRLGLKNAFHDRNATIQRLLVDVLNTPTRIPIGNVGLTYDSITQVPSRLTELCTHHAHYRQSARQMAESWFLQHDPTATVSQLIDTECRSQRWVA